MKQFKVEKFNTFRPIHAVFKSIVAKMFRVELYEYPYPRKIRILHKNQGKTWENLIFFGNLMAFEN